MCYFGHFIKNRLGECKGRSKAMLVESVVTWTSMVVRTDQIWNIHIFSWWKRYYLVVDWGSIERKRAVKHCGLINWQYGFPITKKEKTVSGGQTVTEDGARL